MSKQTCTLYTDQNLSNFSIPAGVKTAPLTSAPIEAKTMAGSATIQKIGNSYCLLNGSTVICAPTMAGAQMMQKRASNLGDVNIMCTDVSGPNSNLTVLCSLGNANVLPGCPR